ncbi:hypothetical protein O3G_MSEX013314 [Manduca sexta]|uniref:MIF4G domain-containing protein n=1 Tax=Manduca sexta TaxID=7130 RepID=A0A922CYA7_MANSE|nr:hypothetical protein O3G_MSEX013314 [Manduca sexta]
MYAQLCKRLSEEAPNFEPPGQPCTFKLLLLNKCRTEFENRAQAFAAFEDKVLTPDEEEKRHLAKCKMLGNIKFIGELGKLEILAESILHRCIQNLLARRAAAEHHEDLECLAQLVRTCGRVLDSERGRGLMDQYFARIDTLSHSRELAPRIRFMLRDVVELRRGGWVPRAAVTGEGPVPMAQLREDDAPPARREPLFRRARPLDEMLAGLHLAPVAADALVPPPDKLFGNGLFRGRSAPGTYARQPPLHYSKPPPPAGKEPRAPKARVPPTTALADVQMRPAANSLMFTNRISKPQPQLPLAPVQQNVLSPSFASTPPLMKEPAITIKSAPDKKDKPRKDKGVNKEEACKLAIEAVEAVAAECGAEGGGPEHVPTAAPLKRLQELHLPDKVLRRAIAAVLEHALAGGSEWAACCVVRCVKRTPQAEALRSLVLAAHPHARLPALLAHAAAQRLVALAELGAWCEGGAHHPLLLEVLQQLRALLGLDRLRELYDESKINLCAYVSGAVSGAVVEAARAAAALPLDQGKRGAGRAPDRRLRVHSRGAGGGARDGRGRLGGAGARQGGAGAREGAGGDVRAAAHGAAGDARRPATGRRVRRAGARAPTPLPQGAAAALVHVPLQPGGVRGGRLPALARGRHRRVPRQGRGTLSGEHVADVAAAAGVGGRGGGGLDAARHVRPPRLRDTGCPQAAPLLFRAHLIINIIKPNS